MSDPKRMLVWMVLFVGVLAAGCALVYPHLADAFRANVIFNGLILGVLAVGVSICFGQVIGLAPATRWIDRTQRGFSSEDAPRMLAALARVVAGREREGFTMSTLAMRSLLDGVRLRLDESRDVARYIVGLLVFLGLLGTFWGLLQTVGGVSRVIGGLTGDTALAFADLQAGLQQPLSGMGTAFSSSLFGLAGALALGILDLQAGHAQNRFFADLEEFLAGRAQLPSRIHAGEGEETLPAYLQGLLENTAENLAHMQRLMAKAEEDRRATQQALAQLAERLGELSEELRTEQASRKETRAYLRTVDLTLSRLLDEVAGAREEVPEALRQEVRLLAQSLAQRPRARA
ncbi:MAG TPA: hypothetical protein VFC18_13935 [Burkholderiales bacterium]|nr:hypothetical protein [Burkholderiales bacterium]